MYMKCVLARQYHTHCYCKCLGVSFPRIWASIKLSEVSPFVSHIDQKHFKRYVLIEEEVWGSLFTTAFTAMFCTRYWHLKICSSSSSSRKMMKLLKFQPYMMQFQKLLLGMFVHQPQPVETAQTHVCACFCTHAQSCQSSGVQKSQVTKFCIVVPSIFSIIVAIFYLTYRNTYHFMCTHRQHQITVRFTGQSRIVGSQYVTCFITCLVHRIWRQLLDLWKIFRLTPWRRIFLRS